MRLTRYKVFLTVGLCLALIGPQLGRTQGPGGPPVGGKGGKGSKGFDPERMFDYFARGKDKIKVSDMPSSRMDPEAGKRMEDWLKKKGVTTGEMTKEQFKDYHKEVVEPRMREMSEKWKSYREGKGPMPTPGGTTTTTTTTPSTTTPGTTTPAPGALPTPTPEDEKRWEEDAKNWFARMDLNKDGKLTDEELGRSRILRDKAKWDTNKNGTIELDEFIAYSKDRERERFNDRVRRELGGRGPTGAPTAPTPPPEVLPVVYRYGKLPTKELPDWFESMDKDKDGQVGLYEWLKEGKPLSEFLQYDLNGDGLLTAEEYLRYKKAEEKKKEASKTPGSTSPSATSPPPGRGPRGGGPRGGGPRGPRPGGGPRG